MGAAEYPLLTSSLLLNCFVVQRTLDSRRNSTSLMSWPRSLAPRKERKSRVPSAPRFVGLSEGEGSPGSPEQAVVHSQRHHGAHFRDREDQVFQHVQVPEGPLHQPRQINEAPDQSDIANYSDFNFSILI